MENRDIIEADIKDLEKKLALKKQEFLTSGIEKTERETFHEVLGEHLKAPEPITIDFSSEEKPEETEAVSPELTSAEDALVELSLTKGLSALAKELRRRHDPFLTDEVHKKLTQEYYQRLVAGKKIKSS